MTLEGLRALPARTLRDLAEAIRAGRLSPPFSDLAVQRYAAGAEAGAAAADLRALVEAGMVGPHVATVLEVMLRERDGRERVEDLIDVVSTGPEGAEVPNRDTAVVVRELFLSARTSVTVAGYAVYQGRRVFEALAERMDAAPDLRVRMYLDVQRKQGDTSVASEIVARFAQRFRSEQWPGKRLPEVFYDPRSLDLDTKKRSSLHAKCVVVDRAVAFVSSANFTEAAQARNIELGLLVRSPEVAARIEGHFEGLVGEGVLKPVAGLRPTAAGRPALRLVVDDARIRRERFKTLLPLYGLRAACGRFGPAQEEIEPEGWVEAGGVGRLDESMFVVHAVGRSMEPRIHDGDLVAFRGGVAGTKAGLIVLAEYRGPADPETGGSYTIKRYESEKEWSPDGEEWWHTRITLRPESRDFDPIEITPEGAGDFAVVGVFVGVVG